MFTSGNSLPIVKFFDLSKFIAVLVAYASNFEVARVIYPAFLTF